MLKLKNIVKDYSSGETTVKALKGVSIEFRSSEFVSILGPSGCGKTTLLNIIGGLDRYTTGDLVISGRSTKEYRDSDWDTYRNHTVGFVFQSYNLIPHQSVLSNVELALTLSGVSRAKRREAAAAALEKVGLGDQLSKKPNQLSGGQMQRVAIARAIVNDPEILLADEPTGALDSETSIQIMDLLKEISKERLVIMVTHNPELAQKYSTRTVKLFDGRIIDDSNPYNGEESVTVQKKQKKPTMSFLTAFSLSVNNLLTKKARTFLTAFAGSIGIIGIALILSLSTGVQAYINRVEEDTLSSYPVTIEQNSTDVGELLSAFTDTQSADDENSDTKSSGDKIYSNNIMTDMMTTMINGSSSNDLAAFKNYLENESNVKEYASDVKYSYSTPLNIFTKSGYHVNPNDIFEKMGYTSAESSFGMSNSVMNTSVWQELIDNDDLLKKQYKVLAGRMPENYNEIVVIVGKDNKISDYTLYTLGLKDSDELSDMIKKAMNGEKIEKQPETSYTYDDFLNLSFKLLPNPEFFEKQEDGTYVDKSEDELYIHSRLETAEDVKVVGILRTDSSSASDRQSSGAVGYLSSLMTHLVEKVNEADVVKAQKASPDTDVLTGLPFADDKETTLDDIKAYISTLPAEEQTRFNAYIAQLSAEGLTETQITEKFSPYLKQVQSDSTYDKNLSLLGVADINEPSAINIYPKDFDSKEKINEIIDNYNKKNDEAHQIKYTDYIGLMLSSVTTIINAISYILIAFVSISLVVSSIMIGIITYISVLERTKEIGVLRAMGASKSDVSRVFNAETVIEGLSAGLLGIGVTALLLIPINVIIRRLTGIATISAILPVKGAVVLVIISVLLTFIAGLIPSRIAAKKDPVTALRTE